jgi:hypothetical protein
MRLKDSRRKFTEKPMEVARQRLGRSRDKAAETENSLRSRHIQSGSASIEAGKPGVNAAPRVNSADALLDESMVQAHDPSEQEPQAALPKPIISIHGRDVPEDHVEPRQQHPGRRNAA